MTSNVAAPYAIAGRDVALVKSIVSGVVPEIRAQLVAELAPIKAQNEALEARIIELEKRPEPVMLTIEEVRIAAKEEATAAVEALPPIDPLPDFAAIASAAAKEQIASFSATIPVPADEETVIERILKAIPVPEPVEPLAPDMEVIARLIQDGISEAVRGLPLPEKGEPGTGLTGAMIDREGDLVLTLSNGAIRNVGRVVGKDGESPLPFTLDDFDIAALDERTIEMSFTQGDVKHKFELEFPVLIGRGVWNVEENYSRGDVVTWGGTAWEAVEPEKGVKPDLSKGGWRILAKRGRDGKDAK